jgi:quercetin dioxygenase-like cupin family protein
MKVVTLRDIPEVPAEGAAEPVEGWQGPVHRWHTHTCDQVLIVTSGSGIVATEHEQREINVGDVAHIKAGERHWHGAKADTTMGHITTHAWAARASGVSPGFQRRRRRTENQLQATTHTW